MLKVMAGSWKDKFIMTYPRWRDFDEIVTLLEQGKEPSKKLLNALLIGELGPLAPIVSKLIVDGGYAVLREIVDNWPHYGPLSGDKGPTIEQVNAMEANLRRVIGDYIRSKEAADTALGGEVPTKAADSIPIEPIDKKLVNEFEFAESRIQNPIVLKVNVETQMNYDRRRLQAMKTGNITPSPVWPGTGFGRSYQ